jgi:hypothetical protein
MHFPPMLSCWKTENVRDREADLGALLVRLLLGAERRPGLTLLADATRLTCVLEHRLGLLAAVGAVCPHIGIHFVGIDDSVNYLAAVHVLPRDRECANDFVVGVDVDLVLLAEVALAALLRPAHLYILLLALGLAPVLRDLALFDTVVLLAAVALDRKRDNGAIDDLPLLGVVALRGQILAEAVEQGLNQAQLLEPLAKPPRGGSIGDLVLDSQTEEVRTGEPVADLVRHLIVGQVVERLQDQRIEHKHHVNRLAPARWSTKVLRIALHIS